MGLLTVLGLFLTEGIDIATNCTSSIVLQLRMEQCFSPPLVVTKYGLIPWQSSSGIQLRSTLEDTTIQVLEDILLLIMDTISKYYTTVMLLEDILLLIMDTISKYYTTVMSLEDILLLIMDTISKYYTAVMLLEDILLLIMDTISKYYTTVMLLEDILLLIMDTISKYYTTVMLLSSQCQPLDGQHCGAVI